MYNLHDMLERLRDMGQSEAPDSAQQLQLKGFLTSEITKRIKEVLGKPGNGREVEKSEVGSSDSESGDEADDDSVAHSDNER